MTNSAYQTDSDRLEADATKAVEALVGEMVEEAIEVYRLLRGAGAPNGLAPRACSLMATALALEARMHNLGPDAIRPGLRPARRRALGGGGRP